MLVEEVILVQFRLYWCRINSCDYYELASMKTKNVQASTNLQFAAYSKSTDVYKWL